MVVLVKCLFGFLMLKSGILNILGRRRRRRGRLSKVQTIKYKSFSLVCLGHFLQNERKENTVLLLKVN